MTLNQFAPHLADGGRGGIILAHSDARYPETPAGQPDQFKRAKMSPVALLTPTYGRDLHLCTLLCESVDRHIDPRSKHYLLVPDCDMPLFAHLASERRIVMPASALLPKWLRPLPRIVQRNHRQYWWSFRARPASGWHVQQILKIAATITLPFERYCILDSDIVFFRDFDLSVFESPNPIPFLKLPGAVTPDQERHPRWVENSHQLLGLPQATFPAPDFIGHIMFWDRDTTRAMVSRIEQVTGMDWVTALCRERGFSEYMLYGYFVENDAAAARVHAPCRKTQCVSYWEDEKLSDADLRELLRNAVETDVAFSVTSFSGTPVATIRAAVSLHQARLASIEPVAPPRGVGVLC